jgi:hypothetical protein
MLTADEVWKFFPSLLWMIRCLLVWSQPSTLLNQGVVLLFHLFLRTSSPVLLIHNLFETVSLSNASSRRRFPPPLLLLDICCSSFRYVSIMEIDPTGWVRIEK